MPKVAILGGSVVGAFTALLFARAGWQVIVVDPELPLLQHPTDGVRRRPGAPHAVQAHGFPARTAHELRTRLPDVYDAVLAAGAHVHPFTPPPHLAPDPPVPADRELDTFRVRRVVLDAVLADAVGSQPGISVVPTSATGIVLEPGTVPRAAAYTLADGGVVTADLLVDAGGRRSPVRRWLAARGLRQPEVTSDCGLAYYSRHHRIRGEAPPMRQFAIVHDFPTHQLFAFRGDREFMTVAMCHHTRDPGRARWRETAYFDHALAATEEFAEWYALLEPTGPVFPMGTVRNRMTSLVAACRPLVLGLHQVGDALTTTNPNRGRGISLGFMAAGRLVDLLADGPAAEDLTLALDAWRRAVLAVYFRESCAVDEEIGGRIRANLVGGEAPATAPAVELPPGHPVTSGDIERAAGMDLDVFRAFVRALYVMDDERAIASVEVATEVRRLLAGNAAGVH